ncbi:thermonuclease family protein [Aciduricibacillus chroicocephali]
MEQGSSDKEQKQNESDSSQESKQEGTGQEQVQQKKEENEYIQTSKDGETVQAKNQATVKLSRVVDGDTIKVYYKGKEETVRYLLMDTPESKKPGECIQPYAEKASKRNEQLIKSGKLTLEFEKSRTDKYGRLLAYVFVDGKSVQETLIKEGLARVAYVYEPPYKYLNQYEQAQEFAKNKKLNIWSKKGYVSSRGFNGCAKEAGTQQPVEKSTQEPVLKTGSAEVFKNCTELRKKYSDGVPEGHPAYQSKMDRDKDGYACER